MVAEEVQHDVAVVGVESCRLLRHGTGTFL